VTYVSVTEITWLVDGPTATGLVVGYTIY